MLDLRKYIPRNIRGKIMNHLWWMPDKAYLQLFYFVCNWRLIDFKNPILFNEKQNWLKLHDRHKEYSQMVDKLAVKLLIDKKLGEGHVFPLLGYWEKFDDINFDNLPNAFVLKCNHDSGSTRVIKDKRKLNESEKAELKKFYTHRLKQDFYYAGREYPYKGIKPYIIAETFMVDDEHPESSIEDYKFFCFDGEPKILYVATERNISVKFDFFDMEFNHLDIVHSHPQSGKEIKKPMHFEEMKEMASRLSKGIKFVRVDFFDFNGNVYFGEFTFFNAGGFQLFYPLEWEKRLGDWIRID